MRHFIFLAALLLTAAGAPTHAQAAETEVTIQSFAFGPQDVEVPAGSTVVWINKDDEPHSVVSSDKIFHSDALDTGERFSVKFDKPGTYGYFCSLHPHMTGKVVVK
jgi:plastocyanin